MWVIVLLKRFSFVLAFLFIVPYNCYAYDAVEISASSAVVFDCAGKTVLFEKNADEQRSIASITKIMTALLAIECGNLDSVVKITPEMLDTEGSSLGLKENDTVTLDDLVIGMMLTSGNDSANAVAYFLGGSLEGFAEMMNLRADELGMKNTLFVTPSGLDSGDHHSSAYDMALLTAAAVQNDKFNDVVSRKSAEITISGRTVTVYNHNRLLSLDEDIFGVKTGFTKKAGRTLVSAKNYKENKIVTVTLNAPDDWNDHIRLYKECQKKYVKQDVKKTVYLPVVGGEAVRVSASCTKTFYTLNEQSVKLFYHPFVYAPVKKGERVGTVCVYENNKLSERLPLTADEDVKYYAEQKRSAPSEIYG